MSRTNCSSYTKHSLTILLGDLNAKAVTSQIRNPDLENCCPQARFLRPLARLETLFSFIKKTSLGK